MRELYRTVFEPQSQAQALVIHCSDSRFRPYFQRFLEQRSDLRSWFVLAVPGGPHVLCEDAGAGAMATGWDWVEFLITRGNPQRVLLVAHSDCLWYRQGPCAASPQDCRAKQESDLRAAAREILNRYPGLEVEMLYFNVVSNELTVERL